MKFFVRCPTTSAVHSLNDQTNIFQENWFYGLGLSVGFVFFLELWKRLFNMNTDCSGGWAKHKVVLNIHIVFFPLSPHSFIRLVRVGKCFLVIPILSAQQYLPQRDKKMSRKDLSNKKWS